MQNAFCGIRITFSECPHLHAGHQFDSIADFDRALRAAGANAHEPRQRIGFAVTWIDGTTFLGRVTLEPEYAGLVAHLCAVCADLGEEPKLGAIAELARRTRVKIWRTVVEERLAAATLRAAALRERLRKEDSDACCER